MSNSVIIVTNSIFIGNPNPNLTTPKQQLYNLKNIHLCKSS